MTKPLYRRKPTKTLALLLLLPLATACQTIRLTPVQSSAVANDATVAAGGEPKVCLAWYDIHDADSPQVRANNRAHDAYGCKPN